MMLSVHRWWSGMKMVNLFPITTTFLHCFPRLLALNSNRSMSMVTPKDAQFGRFRIDESSIFLRSDLSFSFVNLRPIVTGHVLVSSLRVVPRLEDLSESEYTDLWTTVRKVQRILRTHLDDCAAFNVAVQDGAAAGQSVPHVHVHILPRRDGDFKRNDDIYDQLEAWEPKDESGGTKKRLEVPEDGARSDRSAQEMQDEAEVYRRIANDLS